MAANVPEKAEQGGYDHDFVEKIPVRFLCQICTNVYRNPRMTGCCGQNYCESCLEYWSKKQHDKKSCPHCREENFNHILNREKQQEIRRLKIHCTYHQEGCQWVGELDSLQTHLNSDSGCGYVEVNCTNKCGVKGKRKDLNDHLTNRCPLRLYICPYCSHVDTYQAVVSKHNDTCPGYPLTCPYKCGKDDIKRKDMGAHLLMCPLEQTNCLNGCGGRMKRKDLESHLADSCPLRKYKCQYCSHEDTYQVVVSKHYNECPDYPLPCPNKCGESAIRRKEMGVHIARCPLEQVSCLNGCGKEMKRKDLQNHLADSCPMRKYKCQYCSHVDAYQVVVSKHYGTCPDYLLPCPNKCGERAIRRKDLDTHKKICPLQPVSCTKTCGATAIPRKDMNDHRAVCPLEPVECLFKDAGCEARMARKDHNAHMASNTQQHLVQMMTTFQKRFTAVEESQKQSQIQSQIQFQILQEGISIYTRLLLKTCTEKQKVHIQCVQTLLENPNQLHLKNNGDSFTITMPDFSKHMKNQEDWHSPPFYYKAGYKMGLAVYANGTGAGAGTHVSVSLLLLRGEFDDQLTWPMGKEGDGIEISFKAQEQVPQPSASTFSLCPRCTTRASRQRVPDDNNSWLVGSKETFADHSSVQQFMLLHDSVVLKVSVILHRHYTSSTTES